MGSLCSSEEQVKDVVPHDATPRDAPPPSAIVQVPPTAPVLVPKRVTESPEAQVVLAESTALQEFVTNPDIIKWRLLEPVTVTRELGHGAYGVVHLVHYRGEHLARKQLLSSLATAQYVAVFAQEIMRLHQFHHKNIVAFQGVAWTTLLDLSVFTEYMDGGDLDAVLASKKGQLTWADKKLSIAIDIAEGIEYLHLQTPVIIHRDIKSKNILLSKKLCAKLADFGISRERKESSMTSGVGTLRYTAPEVTKGSQYSERVDVYSLGVVLSEMDTEEKPFAGCRGDDGHLLGDHDIAQHVKTGKLRVTFRENCPPLLVELANECTSVDPIKRPSASEVVRRLKLLLP